MTPPPSESQIRRLRDNLYGPLPEHCTDSGWEHCRERWMTPENVQWLLENQPKTKKEKIP